MKIECFFTKIFLAIFLCVFWQKSIAGEVSDALGMYLADDNGNCIDKKFMGKMQRYYESDGVCIPEIVRTIGILNIGEIDMYTITLGIAELTNPEMAKFVRAEIVRRNSPAKEAYRVEIASSSGKKIYLVGGLELELENSSSIGSVRYNEEAIIYKDENQWKLCVNRDTFNIILKNSVGNSYWHKKIDKSIKSIENMEECS